MKKRIVLVLCLILILGCTDKNSSTMEISEISSGSAMESIESSSQESSAESSAEESAYYYSERAKEFSSVKELREYLIEKNIFSPEKEVYDIVSPIDGSDPSFIEYNGTLIAYYFDFDANLDKNLIVIWDPYGEGEKFLKEFVQKNEPVIRPYPNHEGLYFSDSPVVNGVLSGYMMYWVYEGYRFHASVPLKDEAAVVDSIEAGSYIRQ